MGLRNAFRRSTVGMVIRSRSSRSLVVVVANRVMSLVCVDAQDVVVDEVVCLGVLALALYVKLRPMSLTCVTLANMK